MDLRLIRGADGIVPGTPMSVVSSFVYAVTYLYVKPWKLFED